jgi:transcriptional regulator with XRE-family HTH domain
MAKDNVTIEPFRPKNKSEARIFAEEEFRVDVQQTIHSLMLQKKLTQKGLAKALGVSEARVSQIFSESCNVTVRMLARIFFALGERCKLSVNTEERPAAWEQGSESSQAPIEASELLANFAAHVRESEYTEVSTAAEEADTFGQIAA